MNFGVVYMEVFVLFGGLSSCRFDLVYVVGELYFGVVCFV